MKRVMVFGGCGSGKSTLARQLGEKVKLPVIHIDQIFWKPGWIERPSKEVSQIIRQKIKLDEWIFDGNYSSTFEDRLARADTAIYLDIPTWLRLWSVISRIIKSYGRSRPDMALGCPERFDWEFIKWVIFYERRNGREKALNLLKYAPEKVTAYHLKSRSDVRKFLNDLTAMTD